MKKKLLFTQSGGRLGNQLLAFAHLYALWLTQKPSLTILNLSFWPYTQHMNLKGPHRYGYLSHTGKHHLIYRTLYSLYSLLPKKLKSPFHSLLIIVFHNLAAITPWKRSVFCDKGSIWTHLQPFCMGTDLSESQTTLSSLLEQSPRLTASGFDHIFDWSLFYAHKKDIAHFLSFPSSVYEEADQLIRSIKAKHDRVVGVHIRRGDIFKNPTVEKNTIWFEERFFRQFMEEETARYPSDSVAFLISSDSLIDPAMFHPFTLYFSTGSMGQSGTIVDSIVQLSYCDAALISPSSFSAWAREFSDLPCYMIQKKNSSVVCEESCHPIQDVLSYWKTHA